MKILHVVPCADEANGVYHVARMLTKKQVDEGHEAVVVTAYDFTSSTNYQLPATNYLDEVWIHGMWLPREWCACLKVLRSRSAIGVPRLIRMTHGSLSPIYLERQGKWKKMLVAPVERWLFSKTDRVVTTGEWESAWCRQWGLKGDIQVVDLKQFFDFRSRSEVYGGREKSSSFHVLYLGMRHPLKGVQYLEQAVKELNQERRSRSEVYSGIGNVILRVESNVFGEAKEAVWEWCDVLCLPTLSENFGLVVAEALERGKPVIVTDGAPAWSPSNWQNGSDLHCQLTYLHGYREGPDAARVQLLKSALEKLAKQA